MAIVIGASFNLGKAIAYALDINRVTKVFILSAINLS